MLLEHESTELQWRLAYVDLTTRGRGGDSGRIEFMVMRRSPIKIKMYQERGHQTPHVHVDYGRTNHAASYSLESGKRLVGSLPTKYDREIGAWIANNRGKLLKVWETAQAGGDPQCLVGDLKE